MIIADTAVRPTEMSCSGCFFDGRIRTGSKTRPLLEKFRKVFSSKEALFLLVEETHNKRPDYCTGGALDITYCHVASIAINNKG